MADLADLEDDYANRCPLPEGYELGVNAIVLSSSQFNTDDTCRRQWFFDSVLGLLKPEKGFFTYGHVMHKVLERWLDADDQGRGKDGQPVNLYPKGWDANITPQDAATIQSRVKEAIEKGIVVRIPGREVEKDFLLKMIEVDGVTIFVRGTVDLLVPYDETPLIEDHKTTKLASYSKSPRKLRVMNQPLIYSKYLLERLATEGKPEPKRIDFTHNVFIKEPKKLKRVPKTPDKDKSRVKKVIAADKKLGIRGVTPQEVRDRWAVLTKQAVDMLKTSYLKSYHSVPEPPKLAAACNKYGGCAYRTICFGRDNPAEYQTRMEQVQARDRAKKEKERSMTPPVSAPAARPIPPAGPVQINGGPAPAPRPAAPAPRPAPPAPVVKERSFYLADGAKDPIGPFTETQVKSYIRPFLLVPATLEGIQLNEENTPDWKSLVDYKIDLTPPAPVTGKPPLTETVVSLARMPFYFEGCDACAKNLASGKLRAYGINAAGKPCRMCEGKFGDSIAKHYRVTVTADAITCEKIDPAAPTPVAGSGLPEGSTLEQDPFKVGVSAVTGPATTTVTPTSTPEGPQPTAEEIAEGAKRGRGRPPKGFTLLIGVACSKGLPAGSFQLDDFFDRYSKALAAENKVESYYDIQGFDRKDRLCRLAPKIAQEFGTALVFATAASPGTDIGALLAAIRPYASTVLEGVR